MTALGFGIPGIGQSSSAVFAAAPPLPSSPSGPSSRRAVPSRAVRRIYVLVASFSVGRTAPSGMSGRRGHPRRSHVRPPGLRAILTIRIKLAIFFPRRLLATNSEPQACLSRFVNLKLLANQ